MSEQKDIQGKIIVLEKVRYGNDNKMVGDIIQGGKSETQFCEECGTHLQAARVILISAAAKNGVGMPVDIWWCPECKEQR